jgi:hypothetical protein
VIFNPSRASRFPSLIPTFLLTIKFVFVHQRFVENGMFSFQSGIRFAHIAAYCGNIIESLCVQSLGVKSLERILLVRSFIKPIMYLIMYVLGRYRLSV